MSVYCVHFFYRMYKAAPNVCMLCHEECNSTCHGPGPGNCTDCKHVKDGPFCTTVCPTSKYDASGECRPCHENCVDGCKGPENTIGDKGCNSCEKAIINGDVNVVSSENSQFNTVLTQFSVYNLPRGLVIHGIFS